MVEMLKAPSWLHPACTGKAQNNRRAARKGTRQGCSSKEVVESIKEEAEMLLWAGFQSVQAGRRVGDKTSLPREPRGSTKVEEHCVTENPATAYSRTRTHRSK